MLSLDSYFLEVGAPVSMKLATKASFEGKKLLQRKFLGYFPKAKTEECDQQN